MNHVGGMVLLGALFAFAAGLNLGSAVENGRRGLIAWSVVCFLMAVFFLVPAAYVTP
jgi:hypothetical protein